MSELNVVELRMSATQAAHRKRLAMVREEAINLAGACRRIELSIDEIMASGGTLQIQPQMAFVVGATSRMIKDWGVIEYLQTTQNASQKLKR